MHLIEIKCVHINSAFMLAIHSVWVQSGIMCNKKTLHHINEFLFQEEDDDGDEDDESTETDEESKIASLQGSATPSILPPSNYSSMRLPYAVPYNSNNSTAHTGFQGNFYIIK